jgi:ASC-1-like (ASCH) protein|nr:MAG TPA: The ASCH domain adopts a beta-barrel fold similar to that of the PUA domain [Caudoviricetes sp.]
MIYSYEGQSAPGIQSKTTLEAIKNGERTATTRYESDGNIDYWKQAKVGDIIEFHNNSGESVKVVVTKPLTKIN